MARRASASPSSARRCEALLWLAAWLGLATPSSALHQQQQQQHQQQQLQQQQQQQQLLRGHVPPSPAQQGQSDHQRHLAKFGRVKWQTGEGAAVPSACIPDARDGEPITVFVTAVTQPHMHGSQLKDWENTIWGPDSRQNIKNALWVYHENTWDVMHGRPALKQSDVPVVDCFIDVFDAAPGLLELVTKDRHIDELYKVQGIRGLSDDIMDGKVLVRKLVAMYHAASQLPEGSLLVWVDVDTRVSERSLDQRWYQFVMSRDITYISESLCRSELAGVRTIAELPPYCVDWRVESGVMAMHISPVVRQLLRSTLAWYDGRILDLARECLQAGSPPKNCTGAEHTWRRNNIGLNDIYVWAQVLHDQQGLRHGWFANERWTCEGSLHEIEEGANAGKAMPWLGQCQPCVSQAADELVTPFYVDEYIAHRKGGVGPMAGQHAGRFKKMRTRDSELHLPAGYGQEVDPRPACGDFRLTPECVHTIQCEQEGLRTAALYPDYVVPKKFL